MLSKYVDGDFSEHVMKQRSTAGAVSSWATEAEIFAAAMLFRAVMG